MAVSRKLQFLAMVPLHRAAQKTGQLASLENDERKREGDRHSERGKEGKEREGMEGKRETER